MSREKRGPLERTTGRFSGSTVFLDEMVARVVATVVLGLAIIGVVAWTGHHIAYWLAFLISAVLVFGGWIVFDSDWIS